MNQYLRDISGEDFTAKDFRTWAGTVLATAALREFARSDSQVQRKRCLVRAIKAVAERLGNTPNICRKCYIHPEVINAFLDGTLVRLKANARPVSSNGKLSAEEGIVLALLRRRLKVEGAGISEALQAIRARIFHSLSPSH